MTSPPRVQPRRARAHAIRLERVDAALSAVGRRLGAVPAQVGLGLILCVYALVSLAVIRGGFLEYNADGYTRIMHGYEWRAAPRWEVGIWLPLQTWLFGLG